jgi:hypothetical protein
MRERRHRLSQALWQRRLKTLSDDRWQPFRKPIPQRASRSFPRSIGRAARIGSFQRRGTRVVQEDGRWRMTGNYSKAGNRRIGSDQSPSGNVAHPRIDRGALLGVRLTRSLGLGSPVDTPSLHRVRGDSAGLWRIAKTFVADDDEHPHR